MAVTIRVEGERKVNTTSTNPNSSNVTALADGGWVVTWQAGQPGNESEIFQQCFSADGSARGQEQKVNTYTPFNQYYPSVTALTDGGWLVTWRSYNQDGSFAGVYQQRYRADGTAQGTEQRVDTTTAGVQDEPSVTSLTDGGWLVTWQSSDPDGSNFDIYQQRYNADGTTRGGEERVNTTTAGIQELPNVTRLGDGGWLVTWQSTGQSSSADIYQQRYNADGTKNGPEQRVNTTTENDQEFPSVSGLADGGWLVTWNSGSQGIYQQRYGVAFGLGKELGTGTGGDDLFEARSNGLSAGDIIEGGGGVDTLKLIEAGRLDLTAPDVLTGSRSSWALAGTTRSWSAPHGWWA
jgi:hypothetical protein